MSREGVSDLPGSEMAATGRIPSGSGRRRSWTYPKGRQVEAEALEEIRRLLGSHPRRRDLLIEHLHRIQDAHRCLPAELLAALAQEMKLSLVEVYEVATFYAHFDVVTDASRAEAPEMTVRVCDGVACMVAGGERILAEVQGQAPSSVRVVRAPCMGLCHRAPAALVGENPIEGADAPRILEAIERKAVEPKPMEYASLEAYRLAGGYTSLAECREGRSTVEQVIERLGSSGLRGLGGAGFPAAQKWRLVLQEQGPRLMVVNADEGEPGTIKDGHYLETSPHQFLEGMLIAAWAVEAEGIYIYLRDEYPRARRILRAEIGKLEQAGLVGPNTIHLRRGAGAYICGEETAMLESIEGKRGLPRHKPPFPTQVGLFGRPTLIHNVETLYWVPEILRQGPDRFAGQGRHGRKGMRTFSVSGRVREPGVKLTPAGITVRELIEEYCGGMLPGHRFKAYLPGGASGGILPAHLGDLPLDFGTLEPYGCFIGSAAVVILSDQDRVRDVALNLMRFFEDESCGQCTPCRCGTEKMVRLMESPHWDEPLMTELSTVMRDASICGLGQAAPNPLLSVLRYFPEELR